jgi:hypothetical protein
VAQSGLQRQRIRNPGTSNNPGTSKVSTLDSILLKPLAWAGQGASAARHAADQWLQFLADGLAWMVGFIQAVWAWTNDQIVRLTQAPWESWPLWKQILFIIVAGAVIYTLFIAARQLWWATLNVVTAVASFVGTLIVTLPTILLAGAIALAGLWIINNFHGLSSLRSIMTFPDGDARRDGGRTAPSGSPMKARPGGDDRGQAGVKLRQALSAPTRLQSQTRTRAETPS